MQKPVLIVMAKWPAAGRCKTRLSKTIGKAKASEIQERLINHTITVAKALEQKGLIEIQFAISGLAFKGSKRWAKEKGISNFQCQGEGSLGLRMRKQILLANKTFNKKSIVSRNSILIGTDLPSLCQLDVLQAIEELEKNQVVIGPSQDGGYWLIGFSPSKFTEDLKWPFSGIPWGTDKVLDKTIQKAESSGAKISLLHSLNDLDIFNDLSPWHY